MTPNLNWYLALSGVLFAVGVAGVLTRRNALVIFMSIELMLNAANLTLVAYGRYLSDLSGQVFVFMAMAVAAAEVAVGLAVIVVLFRHHRTVDVNRVNLMKW